MTAVHLTPHEIERLPAGVRRARWAARQLVAAAALLGSWIERQPRDPATAVVVPRRVVTMLLDRARDMAELLERQWLAQAAPLEETSPALDKWRREVIEAKGRRTPLERAAAWELTAMIWDQTGAAEHAERARAKARAAAAARPRRSA